MTSAARGTGRRARRSVPTSPNSRATATGRRTATTLAWTPCGSGASNERPVLGADTPFGPYVIRSTSTHAEWSFGGMSRSAADVDEAKAAAQADFEERVLACIDALPAPAGPIPATKASVSTMRLTDGREDHFVMLHCADRSLSIRLYPQRGRAEFEAAELNWLLSGGEKPFVLDFDTDTVSGTFSDHVDPRDDALPERMGVLAWQYELQIHDSSWHSIVTREHPAILHADGTYRNEVALGRIDPMAIADVRRDEREACIRLASDYCWARYSDRPPANLRTPAVFTSHEWQKISEAIRVERGKADRESDPNAPARVPGTQASCEHPDLSPGDRAFFEYSCTRRHDGDHARHWYHSHQWVEVVSIVEEGAEGSVRQRGLAGMPRVYEVRWADGFVADAFDHELHPTPRTVDTRGAPPPFDTHRADARPLPRTATASTRPDTGNATG